MKKLMLLFVVILLTVATSLEAQTYHYKKVVRTSDMDTYGQSQLKAFSIVEIQENMVNITVYAKPSKKPGAVYKLYIDKKGYDQGETVYYLNKSRYGHENDFILNVSRDESKAILWDLDPYNSLTCWEFSWLKTK